MNKPTIALIDADVVVFKAAFANERTVNGEVVLNPPHYAFKTAKDIINKIMSDTECVNYKLFLSDSKETNFRYKVAKTKKYKENRKNVKRPTYEKDVREYLIKTHKAIIVTGAEADDALGIEQDKETNKTIICTNDKDLDMIPGWHYDMDVGRTRQLNGKTIKLKAYKTKQIYFISDPGFLSLRKINKRNILVGSGKMWFCAQMLLGDSTDNIPGLPGYGNVTVFNVLRKAKNFEEAMKIVYYSYRKALTDLTGAQIIARLKEVAQLVWIKREYKEKLFDLEEILK